MDTAGARSVSERSGSIDSDASVSELRPSPGESTESSPSPSAQTTPSDQELPEDLKALGWMVHYSTKSKRFYYYHPDLRESYWYIPDIRRHAAKRMQEDALRIDYGSSQSPPTPTTPPTPGPLFNPLKRSASHPLMETPLLKHPHLAPRFYDFTIPTGISMNERKPLHIPKSHPETELKRGVLFNMLKKKYGELCQARESIEPPPGSLHRWLLERKVEDKGIDPVFPSKCQREVSKSLAREIINNIPIRVIKPKYATDARKQLLMYTEGCKHFAETKQMLPEQRKMVLLQCESMMSWLRKEQRSNYDTYMVRLAFLKRECQAFIREAAEESVNALTAKLYTQSATYAAEVYDLYKRLAEEQHASLEDRWQIPKLSKRTCYPVFLSHPTLTLPTVEVLKDDPNQAQFIYKRDAVVINQTHLRKLEQLYQVSCDDHNYNLFPARVWCMLKRYQTLFGPAVEGAKSLQAALPTAVFEVLHRLFQVSFECFASPLNCYFKQYCSAFPDTDCFFGSRGSILDFKPIAGSLQANPPWCEELIEATLDHFETLLSEAVEPLSFIVFLPDFRDPPPEFLIKAESCRFMRKSVTLTAFEHEYRDGHQHMNTAPNSTSAHGTCVVFLQNDAGFKKWPPRPEDINELVQASRIRT